MVSASGVAAASGVVAASEVAAASVAATSAADNLGHPSLVCAAAVVVVLDRYRLQQPIAPDFRFVHSTSGICRYAE